jgi:hypothetical protein
VAFSDTGLVAGSTHTYRVQPVDAAGNEGPTSSVSDPITVLSPGQGPVFADDFTSGSFANWTSSTGLSIDGTRGAPLAPSARGAPAGQAAFAFRNLGTGLPTVCASLRVDLQSQQGTTVDVMRLRTATNGPIIKVFVNSAGILTLRADASGAQRWSGVALGTGWHRVELCGTVGTASGWTLSLDGLVIVDAWQADVGTVAVGRIQIGDNAAKTWTANFDDVVIGTS